MEQCRVIAITNQKGGVGKTTTTVNLGVGLAKQGKRVLLIDAQAVGEPSAQLTISLVNQGGTAGAAINDGDRKSVV